MAANFPGTLNAHTRLHHISGTGGPAPWNLTKFVSVRVNSNPASGIDFGTVLGYGQDYWGSGDYVQIALGPWAGPTNFAISDGADTVAGATVLGQWMRQAIRTESIAGGQYRHTLWPNLLGSPGYYVTHDRNAFSLTSAHRIYMGDVEAVWASVGEPLTGDIDAVLLVANYMTNSEVMAQAPYRTPFVPVVNSYKWASWNFPSGAGFLLDDSGGGRNLVQNAPGNPATYVAGHTALLTGGGGGSFAVSDTILPTDSYIKSFVSGNPQDLTIAYSRRNVEMRY